MSKDYFGEALSDFTTNFAYGDAIRHLTDRGYTTAKIVREFHYPLSWQAIDEIVTKRQMENVTEHFGNNSADYAYIKTIGEGDYGCEELPEGSPIYCRVRVWEREVSQVKETIYQIPDDWLRNMSFDEGSYLSEVQLLELKRKSELKNSRTKA
jgi:hypothetical protein